MNIIILKKLFIIIKDFKEYTVFQEIEPPLIEQPLPKIYTIKLSPPLGFRNQDL